jgi:gentisate 1,2-dioxygenase
MSERDDLATAFSKAEDLPALYRLLERIQAKNGWAKPTPSLYPQPKQDFLPAHWKYRDMHDALAAAGRLVGTEWAERRNLIMANPLPGNEYPTVKTLVGAYQMVKAGEKARSHRHTPNAMRVVIEAGPATYTIVDGTRIPMAPGDVLLTPNWHYHGHSNEGSEDAYWIDILDAPLVQLLGPMFFEHHPDQVEAAPQVAERSPMRFAHADYRPRLREQPRNADDVRTLELGAGSVDTFDRIVAQLEPGAPWSRPRSTANRIYTVIEGHGETQAAGRTFDWRVGDMLAIPSWIEHRHVAQAQAVLLCVSDAPLMRALSWLRTER